MDVSNKGNIIECSGRINKNFCINEVFEKNNAEIAGFQRYKKVLEAYSLVQEQYNQVPNVLNKLESVLGGILFIKNEKMNYIKSFEYILKKIINKRENEEVATDEEEKSE